jgi:hypothetical protein
MPVKQKNKIVLESSCIVYLPGALAKASVLARAVLQLPLFIFVLLCLEFNIHHS